MTQDLSLVPFEDLWQELVRRNGNDAIFLAAINGQSFMKDGDADVKAVIRFHGHGIALRGLADVATEVLSSDQVTWIPKGDKGLSHTEARILSDTEMENKFKDDEPDFL